MHAHFTGNCTGDGPDPLLGPRIFRALRLGPFEGFRMHRQASCKVRE